VVYRYIFKCKIVEFKQIILSRGTMKITLGSHLFNIFLQMLLYDGIPTGMEKLLKKNDFTPIHNGLDSISNILK